MENPDTSEPVELLDVMEDDELLDRITNYDGPDPFLIWIRGETLRYRNGT